MIFAPLRKLLGVPARAGRPSGPRNARFRPRVENLEQRTVPATLRVGPTETYKTIQSAVNAAASSPGADTILIDPGTYNEQVTVPATINASTNSLVINAANTSSKPVILPTAALTGSMAIVDVNGATGLTLENVIIDGSGTTAPLGVFVENGGAATIQSNTIRNVSGSFFQGGQDGIAIRVGRSSLSGLPATTGTATISSNTITKYGKSGIDVANAGSSATINSNVVTGLGKKVSALDPSATQNGIEIDDGAVGTVSSNTVTKNGSPRTGYGSAGILLFNPGAATVPVSVSSNSLMTNDVGIWVIGGTGVQIKSNSVTNSTFFGIATDSPDGGTTRVNGATISSNSASSSVPGAEGFDLAYLNGTSAHPVSITSNSASNNAAYGFLITNLTSTATGSGGFFTFASNSASGNGTNPSGNWTLATDGTGIAGATGTDGVFLYTATLTASGSGSISAPFNFSSNSASGNAGYGFNFQNVTASLTLSGNATVSGPVTVSSNSASGNQLDGFNVQDLTLSASGTGTVTSTAAVNSNSASSNGGNGFSFVDVTASASGSIQFTGSATVSMNDADGNSGNGYFISDSPNLSLDGGESSTANGNGGDGFLVQGSSGAAITNYKAQSNGQNGFEFDDSDGLTVSGDTAGGASGAGNQMDGFSFANVQDSSITGNTATFNTQNGILLNDQCISNTLTGNTLKNNNQAHSSSYFDANDQSGTPSTVLNTWSGNTIGTKNKSVIH
jgi:parallel beta-helix repeat protein